MRQNYIETWDIMVCNKTEMDKSQLYRQAGWTRIYIGRPSSLGNPFPITSATEHERQRVIDKFESWFDIILKQKDPHNFTYREFLRLLEMYNSGQKLQLECWCFPKKCHGEVIMNKLIEEIEKSTKHVQGTLTTFSTHK